MRRSVRRLLLVALGVAGVATQAGSGRAALAAQELRLQPYRPQESISQSPEAARTLRSFSQAWSAGDANGVARLIPEDGRANVTIEKRGVSSRMSRGQTEAVLSGLFSEAEEAAFAISSTHITDEASAYAIGDWVYEPRSARQPQREKVFVVVHEELPGIWVLSELRVQSAR